MPALLDKITEQVLRQIDSGSGFKQEGAFNLRQNGVSLCHGSTEHIKIKKKGRQARYRCVYRRGYKGRAGAYPGGGEHLRYGGYRVQ
mgnify:CR=1 FL=1